MNPKARPLEEVAKHPSIHRFDNAARRRAAHLKQCEHARHESSPDAR
jgi:hypothetical protein